ncbi:MAG TPA: MFS transporter [Smithella sp.]|nr:MFS transporter [Smithella sp.]HQO14542.1 MFS transporter [Smithellaceae bacterium]HNY49953.1 MFS transporter [Smithella sp.]HOG90481.1 MFS transporter [Smithella sp.]HOU51644.1 MFS transporter [Smithella sp.]
MSITSNKKQLYILLVTTLSSFLTPFMGSAVNVALPAIARELAMTALSLSWVATSFILAAAITLIPLGRLADIYGRRRMFIYGALIFTVASSFCIWSPTQSFLIAARALQGIGGAMIFSTGTAMLISAYPLGERGKILGINITAVYVGLTVGPFIGGILTQYLGWRYIFLFTVFLGVTIVYITLALIEPEVSTREDEGFDLTGSLIYAMALFAIMYGFSQLPTIQAGCLIATGLLLLGLFIFQQLKSPFPLMDIRLFLNNRVFAFSNLAALINYSATFVINFLLSLYLQNIKALTPAEAGLILIAAPAMQALISPFAGRLSDRFEPQIIASIGMALTVIGLVLLIFINGSTSINYVFVCLILLGVGFALFSSPNVNATMSSVEKKYYGVASATLGTMRLTGQMFSMGITMLVFAIILGDHPIAPANHHLFLKSTKLIFSILSVLCCGGIFASLARGKMHNGNNNNH